MNYLAHLALAYPNHGLVVGNFIGDHVRNKHLPSYTKQVQQGVLMHRAIDLFTDQHPKTIALRQLLFGDYRHFSRVLVDIYYDHFLAKHFSQFYSFELTNFIAAVEQILQSNSKILPMSAQQYLKGMVEQHWLMMYQDISGIDHILKMMAKRSKRDTLASGIVGLQKQYTKIEQVFLAFYPELVAYCTAWKKNSIGLAGS